MFSNAFWNGVISVVLTVSVKMALEAVPSLPFVCSEIISGILRFRYVLWIDFGEALKIQFVKRKLKLVKNLWIKCRCQKTIKFKFCCSEKKTCFFPSCFFDIRSFRTYLSTFFLYILHSVRKLSVSIFNLRSGRLLIGITYSSSYRCSAVSALIF